jgi:hypothetical protein
MLSDVLLDFGQSFHSVILIRQLLDSLIGSLQASPDPRFPINAMNSGLFPHKAIESSFLGRIFTLFFAPSQSGNRRESHLRAKSAAGAAWTDSGICKPCWCHSTAPATDHAKDCLEEVRVLAHSDFEVSIELHKRIGGQVVVKRNLDVSALVAAIIHFDAERRSPYSASSLSNSFRCRWTRSTSNADTDGLPPNFNERAKATRFNSW